jgi:DNA-binding transcriptional MerR regulator
MQPKQLYSLKEVAGFLSQPAHRIIHLCETGLIVPAVDATGRGKFRQFDRDNGIRIQLALELLDAGIQIAQISPLMKALDHLMALKEIRDNRHKWVPFDLVEAIRHLGDHEPLKEHPALAWISLPSGQVFFILPRFGFRPNRPGVRVSFAESLDDRVWTGPGLVVNLTRAASSYWLAKRHAAE